MAGQADGLEKARPSGRADVYDRLAQNGRRLTRGGIGAGSVLVLFYAACLWFSDIDLARLVTGLPRLAKWLSTAWPPDVSQLDSVLRGAAETIAIATLGTTAGALLAAPLCLLAARNITGSSLVYWPARAVLNVLRSIDGFVFALLFVIAVGLGPFAGILGLSLHVAGSVAKLWSETIEAADPRPLEALAATGASRLLVVRYGLLPSVLPSLSSVVLYMWEFNIRASTALGLVGAGGIGQQLKNAVDSLDFSSVLTILLVILAMVAVADGLSAAIRRRLTA